MLIPESYQNEVLTYAFRYALGRRTLAPHTIVDILKTNWAMLNRADRSRYKMEIQEAIDKKQGRS